MRAFVLLLPPVTHKHQVNPLQIFSSATHTEKNSKPKKDNLRQALFLCALFLSKMENVLLFLELTPML